MGSPQRCRFRREAHEPFSERHLIAESHVVQEDIGVEERGFSTMQDILDVVVPEIQRTGG